MLRVLVFLVSVSVLGLVGGHPLGAQTAQTCDPAARCGGSSAGDDQSGRSLPGSGRPVGNRIGDDTPLRKVPSYAVSLRDHGVQEIFPAGALPPEHDRDTYAACPGPNNVFQPHGLTLREGGGDVHTLYVVGHGAREAIEGLCAGRRRHRAHDEVDRMHPGPGGHRPHQLYYCAAGRLSRRDELRPRRWGALGMASHDGLDRSARQPDARPQRSRVLGRRAVVLHRGLERSGAVCGCRAARVRCASTGFRLASTSDNVRWGPAGKVIVAGHVDPV